MRALIAFLGARVEQLASLRDHLPALLRAADNDKDEWVQVVSGLVRPKLLPREPGDSLTGLGTGSDRSDGGPEAGGESGYSAAVLRKTVTEVLARAKRIIAERSSGGGGAGDVVGEAPYFGPLEERYKSRKQQLPWEEFANGHFNARYDFVNEFSEDLTSSWHVGNVSNTSVSPTGAAATAAAGLRVSHGGLLVKPPGAAASLPAPAAPVLAQARKVNLAATDPSLGSDGLRRTSKPMALAQKPGLQPGAGGSGHHVHLGGHKAGSVAGGARGARGGGGGGSNSKAGLMMINVDELQAIHAENQSAKEKAKGKRGRKKAKIVTNDDKAIALDALRDGATIAAQPPQAATNGERRGQDGANAHGTIPPSMGSTPNYAASPDAPTIPAAGEIEAAAAMMVLGVAGGEDTETSYLPPALTTLLVNANSLTSEGMEKLENYFQKKMPEGSPQERVKYHEEISTGEDGEQMRVTSYIRLDYDTWMWDRVHKRKRVK